jgi:hypothetical protein
VAAQVKRQQTKQLATVTQCNVLRLPCHRRAAGADSFRGAEKSTAGKRVISMLESGPVGLGNFIGAGMQGDLHGAQSYLQRATASEYEKAPWVQGIALFGLRCDASIG